MFDYGDGDVEFGQSSGSALTMGPKQERKLARRAGENRLLSLR